MIVTTGRRESMGNIFGDAWDAAGDVVDAIAHPADTLDGAWNIVSHPARSMSDFADAATTVLHVVPGMDWLGEQLKDFARTSIGASLLQIVTTTAYYCAAPYVGAQLAAVTFAAPGALRKEQFVKAWTKEFVNRVMATVSWFLANKVDLKVVGDLASKEAGQLLADNPGFQKFLTDLTNQANKAVDALKGKLGDDLYKRIEDGVSGAMEEAATALAAEYGLPPDFEAMANDTQTREDMAATAYDLLAGTNYSGSRAWDPETGRDSVAMMKEAVTGAYHQSAKGGVSLYSTRYVTPKGMLSARQGIAKTTSVLSSFLKKTEGTPAAFAPALLKTSSGTTNLLAYSVAILATAGIGALVYRKRKRSR